MFKKGKIFICLFVILLSILINISTNVYAQSITPNTSTIDKTKVNYYDMRTTWNISNNSNITLNDITINFTIDNNSSNSNYCKEINKMCKSDTTTEKTKIINNDNNSTTYQLHIDKLNPHQTVHYYIDRILEVYSIKYNISENDFNNVTYDVDNKNSKNISKYLDTTQYDYNNNKDELIKISNNLNLNNINNPYLKAKKIFEYVNTTIKYDTNEGNKGLSNVLKINKGVCTEYAELFIALCRINGIPSRTVLGYWYNTNNIGYNVWDTYDCSAHEWSEIYLPNCGWVLVDCTANKYGKSNGSRDKVDYSYFINIPYQDHFIEGYDFLIGNGIYYSDSDMNVIGHIKINKVKQLKKLSNLN